MYLHRCLHINAYVCTYVRTSLWFIAYDLCHQTSPFCDLYSGVVFFYVVVPIKAFPSTTFLREEKRALSSGGS